MLICSDCGQENPDGFQFCGSCGVALAVPRAREVRKTVTVLFADVTGSTALGERLDPESLRRVMGRYLEEMKVVVERHEGTVEKFIGDAVMAVFGIPTLHEDDALRSLRAASEMRERLAVLNEGLERDFGVRLEARIGVNTGEVVAGDGRSQDRLATGDAVNVAARLEQAAAPGEILLGGQTLELAAGVVEVEQVEPLLLKGKADAVAAYRLLGIADSPSSEGGGDVPLVGRRDELARTRRIFDEAVSARRCGLVTVFGPPGIGKSRFGREVAADLSAEAIVLTGRCLPYGEGITYWPLREIFAAAGGESELDAALAQGGAEEIFWAVRKALEARAHEQPFVLIVEDIHWAEPTLLDLIEHLTHWMRDAPVLLLCLSRPELLDERPGWCGLAIALDPLSEAESEQLIEELLGDWRLEQDSRARIRAAAEGNPLFVEQLLAMLAEGGSPEDVPQTIQVLLAARLDALPDEERDLLERASVVGLEFEWEAVGELAPDGRRPPGSQLAALVRKELIRPHEAIQDTFSFRHMLIRDAAYDRIPKEVRSELHEGVANWLEGRGHEFEEIVGYHLEQAYRSVTELGPAGDRARALADRAAEHLANSGLRASGRGDTRAAANLLERASSLLSAGDRRRLSLLTPFAQALRGIGQLEQTDSVLSEAVERARAAGERALSADAAVVLVELRFHRTLDTGVGREDVLREVAAAVEVFEELEHEAGLARALCVRGKLHFWAGATTPAIEDLERSAQHARQVGDAAQEAASLHYVLIASLRGATPVEAALRRVAEVGAQLDLNRKFGVDVLLTRAHLEAMLGRFDDARDAILEARTAAESLGIVLLASHLGTSAGSVELLAGDPVVAERYLRLACDELEEVGELGFLASVAPLLAEALFLQGRNLDGLRITERWDPIRLTVPEDVDAQANWRRVRAKLEATRGDLAAAEHLAREATTMVAPTEFLDLRAQTLADLGEVLRLAGRVEESLAAVQEAIQLFEAKGNVAAAGNLSGASVSVTEGPVLGR